MSGNGGSKMSEAVAFDDEFLASMLGDFLDESDDLLHTLNENLLELDELFQSLADGAVAKIETERMNEMFRAAHSLKGLSAMLGLNDINRLTHKMENVFDAARNDKLDVKHDVVNVVFTAVDRLTGMINGLKEQSDESVEFDGVVDEIDKLLSGEPSIETDVADCNIDEPEPASIEGTVDQQPEKRALPPMNHFADVQDEADISDKYLSIFIDEADLSLDQIAEMLLADDQSDAVSGLLVVCHRIKGAAASIGLQRPATLAHLMEDVLQDLREASAVLSPEMTDAMLQCVDALRGYVEGLKHGEAPSEKFNDVFLQLKAAHQPMVVVPESDAAVEQQDAESPDELDEEVKSAVKTSLPDDKRSLVCRIDFESGLPLVELKARLAYERLNRLGEVVYSSPQESELETSAGLRTLVCAVVTDASVEMAKRDLKIEGVVYTDIQEYGVAKQFGNQSADATSSQNGTPAQAPPETANPKTDAKNNAANKSKPAETLRVDIDRLDQLMNLAGQLVINKARFGQLSDQLKGLTSGKQASLSISRAFGSLDRVILDADEVNGANRNTTLRKHVQQVRNDLESVRREIDLFLQTRSVVNDLSEAVHQLDRVSDGIQKSVMDTRMVPIGPLFGRFKRVIRDITRSNGKDIRLKIHGEKTELDKRMIDELGDPLIHMVRNSADHGIESPEDRIAAGKSPHGEVTLDAFHRGNRIFIQVRDDGKGLVPEKILAKAIDKGIVASADAERLTRHEIFQLIWAPGFSTAEKVTEVSGRGMGMDIVKSKIEAINGTVELDSTPGVGTTITIKLPLTMAILPSLLTVISGDVYALPVESITEIVRVRPEDLSTVHGMLTATVRERVISVVQLEQILRDARTSDVDRHPQTNGATIVIMGTDGQELGLIVDDLMGEEDIVIKAMSENYRNVHGIAGASILGDGRVSLILDIAGLIEMSGRAGRDSTPVAVDDSHAEPAIHAPQVAAAEEQPSMLQGT